MCPMASGQNMARAMLCPTPSWRLPSPEGMPSHIGCTGGRSRRGAKGQALFFPIEMFVENRFLEKVGVNPLNPQGVDARLRTACAESRTGPQQKQNYPPDKRRGAAKPGRLGKRAPQSPPQTTRTTPENRKKTVDNRDKRTNNTRSISFGGEGGATVDVTGTYPRLRGLGSNGREGVCGAGGGGGAPR